jgi:Adenylate and Guanylate cyclase catalytic domain
VAGSVGGGASWSRARHNQRHPVERALHLRVGVHTGEPVINSEGRYFGIAVVVAARLCSSAAGGQILISDVVRALVSSRRLPSLTPVGEIEAKGVDEPVRTWQVDWEPDEIDLPMPGSLAISPRTRWLVGQPTLAWLRALWARVAGGWRGCCCGRRAPRSG